MFFVTNRRMAEVKRAARDAGRYDAMDDLRQILADASYKEIYLKPVYIIGGKVVKMGNTAFLGNKVGVEITGDKVNIKGEGVTIKKSKFFK